MHSGEILTCKYQGCFSGSIPRTLFSVVRDRSRSLDQNPLSTVLPLDWLFSDNEPDLPGSPKGLQHAAAAVATQTSGDLESSGTDTETRNLLSSLEEKFEAVFAESGQSSGAIPKKRPPIAEATNIEHLENSNGGGGDDAKAAEPPCGSAAAKAWQRRAFRRRRTQDRMSVEAVSVGISEGAGDNEENGKEEEEEEEKHDSLPSDLRQRILDILDHDDHDQELDKLRAELVLRKQRVRKRIKQQMDRYTEHSDWSYVATHAHAHVGASMATAQLATSTSPSCISTASNATAAVLGQSPSEEEARKVTRRLRRAARRRGLEQRDSSEPDARERESCRTSAAATNQISSGGASGGNGTSSALATIFGQQGAAGAHIAVDHADTSEGAVHCFQDEFGNWHTYRFGPDSTGLATQVNTSAAPSVDGNRVLSTLLQNADASAPNISGRANDSRYCFSII